MSKLQIISGYLFHESSKKLVHPKGGSSKPGNNTRLVLHGSKDDPARLKVRFIPMEEYFGHIEHVASGMIVHPYGGRLNPGNDTTLVFHSDRHDGALFKLDPVTKQIVHKGGKIWHPSGGSLSPSDDTLCVLHADEHNAAKFYIGDLDGNPASLYYDVACSQPTAGPVGYIFHRSSGKVVQPRGGSSNFKKDTQLVLHSFKDDSCLKMRFVPVNGGPFGFIEHVVNGRVVHPSGGKPNPANNTPLVFHSDRHNGALFRFDKENQLILHKDGKVWYPKGGQMSPQDNTACILSSTKDEAAKFFFGEKAVSPQDNTACILSSNKDEAAKGEKAAAPVRLEFKGDWRLLASLSTKTDHTFTYKTGKMQTMSSADMNIDASIEAEFSFFKSSSNSSVFLEGLSRETWSEEKEVTHTIHVKEGMTVAVWQYVLTATQCGKKWVFQSNIIKDTDSGEKKPI